MNIRLTITALVGLFVTSLALAQDNAAQPTAEIGPWSQIVTPIVALVGTFVLRHIAKLPGWALPVIAALIGAGAEVANGLMSSGTYSPVIGAMLGLAATGLHQLKAQLGKPTP